MSLVVVDAHRDHLPLRAIALLIASANVPVMIFAQDLSISLVSLQAGVKVMHGDLGGLIDLFGGPGGA